MIHNGMNEVMSLVIMFFFPAALGAGNGDPGKSDLLGQGANRMDQLKLALTWNRVDMAEEKIFTPDADWPVSDNIDHEKPLFSTLVHVKGEKLKQTSSLRYQGLGLYLWSIENL